MPTNNYTFKKIAGSAHPQPDNIVSSVPLDLNETITITIVVRRPTTEITLKDYAQGVMDGVYTTLSHDEFKAKFGTDAEDFAAVREFVESFGITVVDQYRSSSQIKLTGTADQFNQAFQITLLSIETDQQTHISHIDDISIPDSLENIIDHVIGFDTSWRLKPLYHVVPENGVFPAAVSGLTPSQVATAYKMPSNIGTGQCIGLLQFGGGWTQDNLNSTFANYGQTPPTVVDVFVNSGYNYPDDPSGASVEVMLDIAVAGGVAPGAKQVIYFAPNTFGDFATCFSAAINDNTNNPSILSLSWGAGESAWSGYFTAIDDVLQTSVAKGITIFAAAGDWGSAAPGGNSFDPLFPATNPYIIACGGTTLELNPDGSIASEVVWNNTNQGYATGGGLSVQYGAPSYQTGKGLRYSQHSSSGDIGPVAFSTRGIPDWGGNADGASGYQFYYGSGNQLIVGVGGTSATAPLFAGCVARLNNAISPSKVGFAHTLSYNNPGAFRDVTSGNNSGPNDFWYNATIGWDAVTGLGSPIGTSLISVLNGISVDATLSNLSISGGGLNPTFTSSITSYTDTVDYGTTSVTITATRNESHATITVNGTTVTSGSASGAISLNVGANIITIVVTAQDGVTTKTYTITVTRGTGSVATLSALTISSGTLSPTFSSGTTSYTDVVSNATTSVTVTPVRSDAYATITVNGTPVTSGSPSSAIGLNVGSNTITIVVTAQDGVTKTTYTVAVTRVSNDATLSALTISSGTLSPSFSSGTTSYTDSVGNLVSSVTVTPTRNESHATITVNGTSVTSGSPSSAIGLNVGSNTITIVVTAQDNTTKTYTITITRAVSSDATLSALTISSGALSPTFDPNTTSYTDSVSNLTSIISVTPTRNESHATITVNGTPVTSGSPSGSINLSVGTNTITIFVTGQDGIATKTYTITVTRAASSDATLSTLTISSGSLIPDFSPNTTSYTDSVLNEIRSVTVTPIVHESNATIVVNGNSVISGESSKSINLNVGQNSITIVVTAQDSTIKTYTITVTREISNDATLASLTISSNSLSPKFNPSVIFYNGYSVFHSSVTVTPIRNESHATITVNGNTVASGVASSPINLNLGSNIITVEVTAADNATIKSYTLLVSRLTSGGTVNLGAVRASNNQVINATANNLAPTEEGTFTYTFADGQLPEGLSLDPKVGYIYGFIPYQPAYVLDYKIAILTTKTITNTGRVLVETKTFNLTVKGEIESSIEWITGSNLGTINTGLISELAVVAKQILSNYTIKYTLKSGSLPPGLTLVRDGSISGKVNYGSQGTYTFTVSASDVYQLSVIDRTFTITAVQTDSKKYTEIYFKPLFLKQQRENYKEFISNEFTFDPKLIYRYFDPNFGVQHDIKLVLEFGIEQLNLVDYTPALATNFYRKRFYFGDIKKAIAVDATGTTIYEIVYIDPIDDMVNNNGTSVSKVVEGEGSIHYPNSIDNMQYKLESITLSNNSIIGVNEYNKPKFMRTPQAGDYKPPTYIRAIPLCYALPGQGDKIISRIKLSGFDFKLLNFEVDRLIVQESTDNATAKYLILEGQSL